MNLTQIILRRPTSSKLNFLCRDVVKGIIVYKNKSSKELTPPNSSSSSSSSSDSDDDINNKTQKPDAATKLNLLLKQMVEDSSNAKSTIQLAQPTNQRNKGREEKETRTSQSIEKKVVNAVKNVAESLGGDSKQTESELLMKLLNTTETQADASNNLSDILKEMKIERDVKPDPSRAEQIRHLLQQIKPETRMAQISTSPRKPRRAVSSKLAEIELEQVDLFNGPSLSIFTNPSVLKESPQLATWEKLHQKELKLSITHPPANYFQEMILWTEQGKFWQFPIDNAFGLEDESKVYFADHVFLEEHLEPWCPPKGPIRHFMELVCVGLSKNSYLTVEAKKEHIEWFKNYFEDKKKLLQEVGALPADPAPPQSIDKQ